MRTRRLVLLASLKEGVVAEIVSQPLDGPRSVDVASAHWFQNARAEPFRRLSRQSQLLVDVEPEPEARGRAGQSVSRAVKRGAAALAILQRPWWP